MATSEDDALLDALDMARDAALADNPQRVEQELQTALQRVNDHV